MFGALKEKLLLSINDYFGIADDKGRIIVCSDDSMEDKKIKEIDSIDPGMGESVLHRGILYMPVRIPGMINCLAFLEHKSDESANLLRMMAMYIETFLASNPEEDSENAFFRNALAGGLSDEDILAGLETWRIRDRARRAVILIYYTESEYPIADMIRNIFPESEGRIIELGTDKIAYLVELVENEDVGDLNRSCRSIVDTIEEELMVSVMAGIGNIVDSFSQIRTSYQNADLALSVGDIFEYEKNVYDYNSLGIGKLIYTSGKETLEDFLSESVSRKTFEMLDDEIIKTVQCFFKNNLNISETARQMYLHRNTLVYRIEKVLKITGLDLRNFDDAVSFKAAYMVKCYIDKLNQER